MTRRTAIITGGNSGLGYQTATCLAKDQSWHVVLACRNLKRGSDAVRKIVAATGNDQVETLTLELASLASVRHFVSELAKTDRPPIAAILCNAGIQVVNGLILSEDGYEITFAVNHLAHFLLVNLLLPQLGEEARIIFVSSGTHDPEQKTGMPAPKLGTIYELAHPDPTEFRRRPGLAGRRAYTTSKLCNILCTYEMDRRLAAKNRSVHINAFDPGLMPGSGLARDYAFPKRLVWYFVLPALRLFLRNINSPKTSGKYLANLVTDARFAGARGKYFVGDRVSRSSEESYDEQKAKLLWNVSQELAGLRNEEQII
jgi:light-dependent protochlorophyllide reductase